MGPKVWTTSYEWPAASVVVKVVVRVGCGWNGVGGELVEDVVVCAEVVVVLEVELVVSDGVVVSLVLVAVVVVVVSDGLVVLGVVLGVVVLVGGVVVEVLVGVDVFVVGSVVGVEFVGADVVEGSVVLADSVLLVVAEGEGSPWPWIGVTRKRPTVSKRTRAEAAARWRSSFAAAAPFEESVRTKSD